MGPVAGQASSPFSSQVHPSSHTAHSSPINRRHSGHSLRRHSKTSPQDSRKVRLLFISSSPLPSSSSAVKMTLIPCVSEKLFRPWDTDTSAATPASMKEEPRMAASPGAASSSGDESETSSTAGQLLTMPFSSAIQQAYSAHMMSAAMAASHHHPALSYLPWTGGLPRHHHHHHYPVEAPSMERFLASLEATPEALHPTHLAALGMGPSDIGELYQLAGFKPLHHPVVSTAAHPPQPGKKQRPKRFRCPHCQVAFSNNGQLKGHVRSHTGKHFGSFL